MHNETHNVSSTVKPANEGTAKNRNFLPLEEASAPHRSWSLDPRNCKRLPLKTGFHYAQVPRRQVLIVLFLNIHLCLPFAVFALPSTVYARCLRISFVFLNAWLIFRPFPPFCLIKETKEPDNFCPDLRTCIAAHLPFVWQVYWS